MKASRISARALIVGAVVAIGSVHARAVIVDGPNGTGSANTTQPPGIPGWNNSGTVAAASAVYLGNQWAITASHVAGGGVLPSNSTFTLPDGRTFTTDQASTRLTNPSDSSATDLILFHLSADPGLPKLALSMAAPAGGTPIYSMGYGLTRSGTTTFGAASGYTESAPQVNRWGTNLTTAPPGTTTGTRTAVINTGNGDITIFSSNFDSGGTASESQVSSGDSGGAVFDANNVLLGLNNAQATFTNQPANTAIFGDASDYADIATYRSQIVSITGVPEPTSLAILVAPAMGLLLRRRRRYRWR